MSRRLAYRAFAAAQELEFRYAEDAIHWTRTRLIGCSAWYRGQINIVVFLPGGREWIIPYRRYVVGEDGIVRRTDT